MRTISEQYAYPSISPFEVHPSFLLKWDSYLAREIFMTVDFVYHETLWCTRLSNWSTQRSFIQNRCHFKCMRKSLNFCEGYKISYTHPWESQLHLNDFEINQPRFLHESAFSFKPSLFYSYIQRIFLSQLPGLEVLCIFCISFLSTTHRAGLWL